MQKSQYIAIFGRKNAQRLKKKLINLLFIRLISSLHVLRSGNYVIIICNFGIERVSAGIAKEQSAVFENILENG